LIAFFLVFRKVLLDEVVELVSLCPVARTAVAAVVGDLVILVGEYLGKAAALWRLVLVAMAPFQAFELGLGGR
jgi:hypothetical protein